MKPVIDAVLRYISPSKIHFNDFVDRCCCRYTPLLLIVLMFITGTIDTFGKPLNCMVPAEFPASWQNYAHQYCFTTGTYTYGRDEDGEKTRIYVDYYQWVPFVLILQGFAMRAPQILWRSVQNNSDFDFTYVNNMCLKARTEGLAKRMAFIEEVAKYLAQIKKHRVGNHGLGNLIGAFYTVYKFFNLFMVVMQICVLNWFLGYNTLGWGFMLASYGWNNRGWEQFNYFPRVAYCEIGRDFLGSVPGGLNNEIRCALGINMINEKVFMILYFWFYGLAMLSIASVLFYIRLLFIPFRVRNVDHFTKLVNRRDIFGEDLGRAHVDIGTKIRFTSDMLGLDGLLLLRFVRQNCGPLIASELGSCLYHIWLSGTQPLQLPPNLNAPVVHLSNKIVSVPCYENDKCNSSA